MEGYVQMQPFVMAKANLLLAATRMYAISCAAEFQCSMKQLLPVGGFMKVPSIKNTRIYIRKTVKESL
jgi:hypothetical protein